MALQMPIGQRRGRGQPLCTALGKVMASDPENEKFSVPELAAFLKKQSYLQGLREDFALCVSLKQAQTQTASGQPQVALHGPRWPDHVKMPPFRSLQRPKE